MRAHHHPAAPTTKEREAAATVQLRHRLAGDATASVVGTAATRITAAPTHRGGTLLLIGAGVLFFLAGTSGALLRKLWRLHGEWYGGNPA